MHDTDLLTLMSSGDIIYKTTDKGVAAVDNNQTPKVDIYKLMSAMSSLDKYYRPPTLPPLERAQRLALTAAPLISCGWWYLSVPPCCAVWVLPIFPAVPS